MNILRFILTWFTWHGKITKLCKYSITWYGKLIAGTGCIIFKFRLFLYQ